jgi:hypothetical protein
MAKKPKAQPTLVDRWWLWIYNNPVSAAVIIACSISTSAVAAFHTLPEAARNYVISFFGSTEVASNGWAYVGNLDAKDDKKWTSRSRVELVSQSSETNRQYPFREGDRVRVVERMPQVIIDFKHDGKKNVLAKPTKEKETVNEDEDYTKLFYNPGAEYEVMDVDVNGKRDKDRVMWLRLSKPGAR